MEAVLETLCSGSGVRVPPKAPPVTPDMPEPWRGVNRIQAALTRSLPDRAYPTPPCRGTDPAALHPG